MTFGAFFLLQLDTTFQPIKPETCMTTQNNRLDKPNNIFSMYQHRMEQCSGSKMKMKHFFVQFGFFFVLQFDVTFQPIMPVT